MSFQLPAEAQGVAAGVLFYSFVCEIANILLVWLVWTHRERTSYVALISYFTLLSTTASIIQQFRDYAFWIDVRTASYQNSVAHAGDPEVVIANGSVGASLVLFYIQYFCYNVEATLVFFWAFALAQSVYGWSDKRQLRQLAANINLVGKVVSIVLPVVMISLLQAPTVRSTFAGFLLVADILLMLSMAGGGLFMLAILWRYIQSRRRLDSWHVRYGQETNSTANSTKPQQPKQQGIYDRWLLIRFTIGFVFLGIFEVANVLFQVMGRRNNTGDGLADGPNLGADQAKSFITANMPGVTASLLAFVVFGTTTPFRRHMYETFVPARIRQRAEGLKTSSRPQEPRVRPSIPNIPLFHLPKTTLSKSSTANKGVHVVSFRELGPYSYHDDRVNASEDLLPIMPTESSPRPTTAR